MLLKYPMSFWSILIPVFWTVYLIGCLSPFHLVLFLEFCSVLSFGPYFCVSSFWQPPCVCFCVLGRAALTPCLSAPVKLYGTEPQVIPRVQQSMPPLCCSVLGMACRGDSAAAWPLEFCPEGSCLPTRTSLSPHLPLVHFQLLPWCWIPEGVRLCESYVCCRPFKRMKFLLLPKPRLVFTARSYGDLSSWCWEPGLGSLAPEVSLMFFTNNMYMWDCLFPSLHLHASLCLCLSYPSGWVWLL